MDRRRPAVTVGRDPDAGPGRPASTASTDGGTGIDQRATFEGGGGAYAIADLHIRYRAPARLDDALIVAVALRSAIRAAGKLAMISATSSRACSRAWATGWSSGGTAGSGPRSHTSGRESDMERMFLLK